MTPVQQTILGTGRGDCLRACIASILDLAADAVPNFVESVEIHPLDAAVLWLEERGFKAVWMQFPGESPLKTAYVGYSEKPVVLLGDGHGADEDGELFRHAVVGRPNGRGFVMLHDPDPNGKGLNGEPDGVMWIL